MNNDKCVACGAYTTNYLLDGDHLICICSIYKDAYYQSEYGCCEQCGITLKPGIRTEKYHYVEEEYGIILCDRCSRGIINHKVDSLKYLDAAELLLKAKSFY